MRRRQDAVGGSEQPSFHAPDAYMFAHMYGHAGVYMHVSTQVGTDRSRDRQTDLIKEDRQVDTHGCIQRAWHRA